jgi:hypothetical protein
MTTYEANPMTSLPNGIGEIVDWACLEKTEPNSGGFDVV